MKKSTLVAVTLAIFAMLLAASGVLAQDTRKAALKESAGASATKTGAAIIAVRRDDRLEFVTDKARLLAYVQKAFDSQRDRAVIKDISIRPFEKEQYFAVQIERQGTLFIHMVPTGGGIQGKFYLEKDKYLYCASEGCTSCFLDRSSGPVVCSCNASTNQGTSSGCKLMPRLYVNLVATKLDGILAAEGFELTDGSTQTEANPKLKAEPPRPGKND